MWILEPTRRTEKPSANARKQGYDGQTEASAGTRHGLSGQKYDDDCEATDRPNDRSRIIFTSVARGPSYGGRVYGPRDSKQRQAIKKRSEMVPVRKKSRSLGVSGPMGDLDQSNEDAKDSNREDNEAQPTPFSIGKQQGAQEDRKWREKGQRAQPRFIR